MPTPKDHELPSYETQQRGPEHQRSLERGNNQKWLSLFVRSGAKDASSMPMFFENDDILGRVEIEIDKPESVKGVTISVSFDLHSFRAKILRLKGLLRSREEPPSLVRMKTFS